MTVHALLADPPVEGHVLDGITALSDEEAAELYAAMVKDTMRNVDGTGGDLLVNYPPARDFPDGILDGPPPETALRELAEDALDDLNEVRFEVQVGDSFAERASNTASHLLEEEDAASVAILDGLAPTLLRTALDSAAMTLRRNEVVLAPGAGGRIAYLGLTEPIDLEPLLMPPEVESVTAFAIDTGYSVDFLPMHPVVSTDDGLATAVASIRSHRRADRLVPEFTAEAIEELGIHVGEKTGRRGLLRD